MASVDADRLTQRIGVRDDDDGKSILPSIDAVDRGSIDWSGRNYRSTSTVLFYHRSMPSIEDRSIGVVTPLGWPFEAFE
jgi:hypothetical protein